MKSKKWLLTAGVVLSTTALLVACGKADKEADAPTTFSYVYAVDPASLDYSIATRTSTTDVIGNVVDGLMENDQYGNVIPSLAEDWSVSKDGLTYTYKLRKGVKWYTSEGEEYAEVTAHDFVTGLKHVADGKSDGVSLIQNSIKGLDAYMTGETNDFSTVGVKALDDYTVEYTLNKPESFWNSKVTTATMLPVNEEFLKATGKDYGAVTPAGILYNGPYILKTLTSKSLIEYEKNPNYWDKEKVKIEKIKLTYYDGSDQESLIRSFSSGAYTTARLFPSSSNFASTLEQYGDKITYSPQDSSSYYFTFNVNRQSYNKTAKTSEEQKTSTKEAMLNKDFRQAINFAFNRHSYAAQLNGEDGADKIIRNSLVPDNFVQAGGKNFGHIAQAELVNYGDQWKGVELVDGKDSIYNPDKAKAAFEKAKKDLESKGVTFPIHLDVPVEQTDTIAVQQSNSFKQSIESTLGAENVVIDVLQMTDNEKETITSQARVPSQKDYDLNSTGWAPSYQDPASYLNIMDPKSGSAMKHLGITKGKDKDVVAKLGLDQYKKLLDDADSETTNLEERYEKYAKAQAWLTDSSLLMSTASSGGSPVVSNVVPFSKPYSQVGIKGDPYIFKGMKLQKDIVTTKEYEEALKKWQKEKLESNGKYQKELEKHIK
ncbi:peptide ABC transporter substrate-binding protein [Streptococcus oralis subsp. dentisani]|uniref:Peptide ABC transporter substrate-binding protein n=2 Tax=Streptococcus TaxID=1301 RepID=A0A2I1UE77_STROR|nr:MULTISPECIES: peptide ABC transporter substrate-binding protein [Streptococcus]KXA61257.1 oligopeptide-binding protein SarA [Streptococcus mitis]MDK7307783.1 peptide ABC transporter substrate-binding protein [Streptococcus oralis]MDK7311406.1 peptide ABC transporter substrate-binding protein [Streptococcus oralis]MDU3980914.1 peptide ABC transporter substrate-binding protein [Streptococcus mitis]PLA04203.1 peptide ABC transporter substrate-binding protein [Streptococcus oralis subsp. dentis